MQPMSPLLTILGTVLKDSDDILEVTFDSKITFDSIFVRFPEQLLIGLVFRELPA